MPKLLPAISYNSHCQDGNNVSGLQVILASLPKHVASFAIRLTPKQDDISIVRKAVSSGQITLDPATGVLCTIYEYIPLVPVAGL